ncbi:MAG: substrate-binding domain-containing protein [Actinobacteria bacterium]|nr:substrate-binding domain-containing protein [Actinomycetota bacterium]
MPRNSLTTRGVVLIALAGIALSACTPPLPPDVLAAQAETNITCQSGTLDVSVPEDFLGAMDAVGAALTSVCPDQGFIESVDKADAKLRIVDHAPTAEETAAFTAQACPTGTVIVVPAFGYAVALAYDVIGLEGLVMTPQAIAGILDGTVTSWEDPLITGPNADYDMTGLPDISVLYIDKPQGSVEAMTTWLTAEDPAAWPGGVTDTLSMGTAFPTQVDLMGELTLTEGTVAVIPAFSAVNNGIAIAAVPVGDLIISPDDTQLLKVGVAATNVTVDAAGNLLAGPAIGGVPVAGQFDLASSKIVLAEGQPVIGWPIMGMAHMMVCDDPADPLALSAAQYVVRLAGQGSLETFGVTPLPEPIRVQTFTPLKVAASLASANPLPASAGPTPTSS